MRKFLLILIGGALLIASCSKGQTLIDDFESGNLDKWVVEGNAFLVCPKNLQDHPDVIGGKGDFIVANALDIESSLSSNGEMTSESFTITQRYINFLMGGTKRFSQQGNPRVELLIDGEVVCTASPYLDDPKTMDWCSWDVKEYKGEKANIRISIQRNASYESRRQSGPVVFFVDQFMMSAEKMSSFNLKLTVPVKAASAYLLIPSSNEGGVSKLSIMANGKNILGEAQQINLAHSEQDYSIPIDISAYNGQILNVVFSNVYDSDLSVTGMTQSPDRNIVYDEPYRQIYHFTPDFGWTNDPNGMVYYDGEYHLAYQANPYGTKHFNMHWGNAVSTDLVHWTDLRFIVAPDSLGAIFSGSSVVDSDNTAGFGADAIIGMYTSASRTQKQSIAYSTDRGRTYTKYQSNPVLTDDEKQPNFRDPKLMRYGDKWIVSVAAGDVISFYESKNLIEWTKLSDFGKGIGSHDAVWECPDLLKFEYNGREKWVLIVNINPGGPNGGSVAQYFIGDFDGREFVADELPYPLWIDEGVDNYAGVTFSNTGDRHIFLGWMSNWLYSNHVPTINFRNSMTIARDLSLKHNGKHLFLASTPSPEIMLAKSGTVKKEDVSVKGSYAIPKLLPDNDGAYLIEFTVTPGTDDHFSFNLS